MFVELGPFLLTVVIGAVLPALTAIVTARDAPAGRKAVLLAVLSAVTGFAVAWQQDPHDWKTGAVGAFWAFIAAVGAHFGLLKPIDVTGSGGLIARKVPGGVGGRT